MDNIKYCANCRRLWKEEDCITGQSYVGEAWGHPIYEEYIVCPDCSDNVCDWEGEPYLFDEFGDEYDEEGDDYD